MDIKNTILKNIANQITHGNWQNQGDRLPLPKTSSLALCLTNSQFHGSQFDQFYFVYNFKLFLKRYP